MQQETRLSDTPSVPSLPACDEPLWLSQGHPLAGYRSTAALPDVADVVVVGAGLTGASAASASLLADSLLISFSLCDLHE